MFKSSLKFFLLGVGAGAGATYGFYKQNNAAPEEISSTAIRTNKTMKKFSSYGSGHETPPDGVWISELGQEKLKRWRENKNCNSKSVCVLSDFDLTITPAMYLDNPSERMNQCHGVIIKSFGMNTKGKPKKKWDFLQETRATSLDDPNDWWKFCNEYLIEDQFTEADFQKCCDDFRMQLRNGFSSFCQCLDDKNIPFCIVSAGITNVIQDQLKFYGVQHDNISYFGNTLFFDANGVMNDFGPIVSSFNKHTLSKQIEYLIPDFSDRKFIVAMGDHKKDLKMLEDLTFDDCLRVGFCNNNESLPEKYRDYWPAFDVFKNDFDIVLQTANEKQATFEFAEKILKHVIDQ